MNTLRVNALVLICSLFIASIDCRPSNFRISRLKGVNNKHDIKNLIGALKNYLHTQEDEDEDNATEEIEERSKVEERSQNVGNDEINKELLFEADPFVQEAHLGSYEDNVRVMRYKVIYYTMDHPISEVKKWMNKGFSAWSNPGIDAYLRKHGCPTLQFEETSGDDYDFAVNFDYEWFDRNDGRNKLSWYYKRDSTIYINDYKELRRDWIAHAVAYDTCDMLGCTCTNHAGKNEIMACGPVEDWNTFTPTQHDYRTLAAALGCQKLHKTW